MRNSEVVQLVESVNGILQTSFVSDGDINSVQKWAQMGIEETGSTSYRVALVLANELGKTRNDLATLVGASSEETLERGIAAAGKTEVVEKPLASVHGEKPIMSVQENQMAFGSSSLVDDDDLGEESYVGGEMDLANVVRR